MIAAVKRDIRSLMRESRIVYLRWRIREAEKDIAYEYGSLWPRQRQIDAWRLDIGAWRVEILTLENEQ